MKKLLFTLIIAILPIFIFAQVGHIMQGIFAVNMSMGGAATSNPTDISGAINWNPAGYDVTGI
jgi:long-chain fatty acid transport protein